MVKRKPFFRTGAPEVEATEMKLVDPKPRFTRSKAGAEFLRCRKPFAFHKNATMGQTGQTTQTLGVAATVMMEKGGCLRRTALMAWYGPIYASISEEDSNALP